MIEQNDGSNRQTKHGWKYLSFVLMGILAFGVTVTTLPQQAMAKPPEGSPGEDMMAILQQIREIVLGIQERTDNLPDDPASQSAVESAALGDVTRFFVASSFDDRDELTCTSDSVFLILASMRAINDGGTLDVQVDLADSGGFQSIAYNITEPVSLSFGSEPGDEVTLEASGTSPSSVVGFVTVQSPLGANISCVQN